MALKLRIVSPERVEFEGEVESVLVPGALGQFEILNNHAPIVSSLVKGIVEYKAKDGKHQVEVAAGFVSVKRNEVNICVEL